MVTEEMLDNAHQIANEELENPENITKKDLAGFRKRFNQLLDSLEKEAEDDVDEDE